MKSVSCTGVLIENEKVLLLKRHPHMRLFPSQWCLPGGKKDAGETDEECCIREFYEETGILVEIIGLYGVMKVIDGKKEYDVLTFLVKVVSKEDETGYPTDEHEAAAWVGFDELKDYDITEQTSQLLEHLSEERHESWFIDRMQR